MMTKSHAAKIETDPVRAERRSAMLRFFANPPQKIPRSSSAGWREPSSPRRASKPGGKSVSAAEATVRGGHDRCASLVEHFDSVGVQTVKAVCESMAK